MSGEGLLGDGFALYLKSRKSTKVIAPTMTTKIRALTKAPSNLVPVESESCRRKYISDSTAQIQEVGMQP